MATNPHEPLPVASEETPLIHSNHQEITARCSNLRSRFSPAILIIPIALICRFTIMLPSTTNFRILQLTACRFWYHLNDPKATPSSGQIPDELCSIAGVNRYYAAMASILAVGDGVGSLFFVFSCNYENAVMFYPPCSGTWLQCCQLLWF